MNSLPKKSLLVILGPTATGKSALGLRLAQELDGEIINGDALQVYRGFDVGTAKPTAEERRTVPHHLYDILDPDVAFSAGEFIRRARPLIEEIKSRAKTPIVVGGSGFYLRALLEGLSPIPPVDAEVRRVVEERLDTEGLEALYGELEKRDPETARRLGPRDRQRIVRALEVFISSGRPLSSWIARRPATDQRLQAEKLGLTLERSILYDRIAGRVKGMIDRGWVAEVTSMLDRYSPEVPAFQAIGYRQIVRLVRGDWGLEEAAEDIIRATRQYAKRQMTWFRREVDVRWFSASNPEPGALSRLLEPKSGGVVAQ